MKLDLYMRLVLTIITLCLLWNVFRPLFIPRKVEAYGDILSVNIERIGGHYVYDAIPVNIKKINR